MEFHVPIHTPAKANAETHAAEACERSGQGGWAVPVVSMLGATLVSAQAAYRARREPWDLAFVLFALAALALLFWCLRRYERLALEPSSSDQDGGERRRLKLCVWALSTALSVAFAWRVAAIMPPVLKAAVWGMTSTVVIGGFYVLFVCKGSGGYSELDTSCQEATSLKPDESV